MGVPKFFRYISERYPCLSEKLQDYQIPEFDNLYLDMNGIVHICSHPNDADVHFRITEEQIFKNIFRYTETLFRTVQPRKLFFMAVDGVAPRAKINQQRGRRFRTAKEAEMLEQKAKAKGIEIPKEARFDSNCITPGTLFMAKLNEHLKYFVAYKISTDKLWQNCKIIYSGSEVPGEGEHKIMDYIRYMKAQPDYDSNLRHCLYGLDADLIMLGLCTHEPHFSLLREEVKFGQKQKRISTAEETQFCLLHLSVLREYIEHEFEGFKETLKFKFDVEKVIDDWVLMGFLVGNDFIPHLPHLHIANGALPILYKAYMDTLPTLDGYINEGGTLMLDRFETFMEKLSYIDKEHFEEHSADLRYFEAKTGRHASELDTPKMDNDVVSNFFDSFAEIKKNKDLMALIKSTEEYIGVSDDEDESDSDELCSLEFELHKRDYYKTKMEYENVDAEVMRSQAEGYVRAIQWNLHYYYNGCCSWSWYYPHHYAPYMSDIKGFKDLKLEYDMGEPFLPFQQLLGVLPAASKSLLPETFQKLLTTEESPIIDYYPLDFRTDLNGKKQEWEAVVLIPFIDEGRLLKAMKPYLSELNDEEMRRNKHGPMCSFTYTEQSQGVYEAPQYFPSVESFAELELIERKNILVPINQLVKGLCPGVRMDVYFSGLPTLRHINHTAKLEAAKVKVFEQPSRGESMMLYLTPKEIPAEKELANMLLGKSVFVDWPYMSECLVVAISSAKCKYSLNSSDEKEKFRTEEVKGPLAELFQSQSKMVADNYKTRFGVIIGETKILVYGKPIAGRQYIFGAHGKMCLEKQWAGVPLPFAYQVILQDIEVQESSLPLYKSINEVFPVKSTIFMLGHPHYGAQGEVNEPGYNEKTGRVKVTINSTSEPKLERSRMSQASSRMNYMYGNTAAQRLGISSHLLSRITGSIFVIQIISDRGDGQKENIGLNLKFNKRNEEVPGYTKRENNQWLYSNKCVDLIRDYMRECPIMFENLAHAVSNDIFEEKTLFTDESETLSSVSSWLKARKVHDLPSRPCGTEYIEEDTMRAIEGEITKHLESQETATKGVVMQVKPHLLFKPSLHHGHLAVDANAEHYIFDRVVCVKENFTVPLGYKGVIIGIVTAENSRNDMYEILFDKEFVGGISLYNSAARAYRLSLTDFINISHGMRAERRTNDSTANRVVQTQQQVQKKNQANNSAFPSFNINKVNKLPGFFDQRSPSKSSPSKAAPKLASPKKPNLEWREEQKKMTGVQQKWPGNPMPRPSNSEAPRDYSNRIESSLEYHQLWTELEKMQQKSNAPKPMAPPTPALPKPNLPPPRNVVLAQGQSTQSQPQDPSAFLKAVLKISDESSVQNIQLRPNVPPSKPFTFPQPPAPPISSDTPSTVQHFFNQARQASNTKPSPVWYGSKLISHFQVTNTGMPRYSYVPNSDHTSFQAQIVLPDNRVFFGDYCRTHELAAESAAERAYKALHLGPTPDWFNRGPVPFNWVPNVRPPMMGQPNLPGPPRPPGPPGPMWNPFNKAPSVPQMWAPEARLPMNPPNVTPSGTTNQHLPPMPNPPNFHSHSAPMKPDGYPVKAQHQQSNVNRSPQKTQQGNKRDSNVQKSMAFVPLQAQKKNRHTSAKQATGESHQSNKKANQSKEQSEKFKEQPVQENWRQKSNQQIASKGDSTNSREVAQDNSSHSQASQKNTKQRKSRIAAKFGAPPMSNGNNQQQ